jgi:hypothetical protein
MHAQNPGSERRARRRPRMHGGVHDEERRSTSGPRAETGSIHVASGGPAMPPAPHRSHRV